MQLTQIQGNNVGQKVEIPKGQIQNLPVPPNKTDSPVQGYIEHNDNGQKIIVPHANIPVSINGQQIVSPTQIKHGDTVTINYGSNKQITLAAHNIEKKLTENDIKKHLEKIGENPSQQDIHAILIDIEKSEKQKNFLILIIIALIIIILAGIIFLYLNFSSSQKDNDKKNKSLESKVTSFQTELTKNKDEKEEEINSSISEIEKNISDIETKINNNQKNYQGIDSQTKKQIDELIKKLEDQNKNKEIIDIFEEKLKSVESRLQEEITVTKKDSEEKIEKTKEDTYYKLLIDNCIEDACCVNSVNKMIEGKYKLQSNGVCPENYSEDRLKCMGSYVWCIPETEDTSKVGN